MIRASRWRSGLASAAASGLRICNSGPLVPRRPPTRMRPEPMSNHATIETLTKRCNGECGEVKPASAFFATATTPDKLTHRCRECVLAAGRRDRAEREARTQKGASPTSMRY